jgi:hypothetical protein
MSDLLNSASLVLIPSGYKEDIVYSAVPTDGSGDLSFTRASNGTRINSAGLVEVCPWNLLEQSETFSNAAWANTQLSISVNSTTAPNGTTTADTITTTASGVCYIYQSFVLNAGVFTLSIYAKKGNNNFIAINNQSTATNWVTAVFDLTNGTFGESAVGSGGGFTYISNSIEDAGNGWYRCSLVYSGVTANPTYPSIMFAPLKTGNSFTTNYGETSGNATSKTLFIWGAQLNIGSTAKPYFPTTDRLNVPRLTYQNGGGGCPSLLLEKQSTNLLIYSEQFDQWSTNGTTTANAGISPDGTQNADRLNYTSGNIYWLDASINVTNGVLYTYSLYVKPTSVGNQFRFYLDGAFNDSTVITTDSSDWKRYSWTFTASATGSINPHVLLGYGYSSQSILAWGAQLEASSYPTSLINTTSASATRVADFATTNNISSLFGSTEGSFFIEMTADFTNTNGSIPLFLRSSINSTFNRATYLQFGSGTIALNVYLGGALEASIFSGTYTQGQKLKIAFAYKQNDFVLYINGTLIGTDTSGNISASLAFIDLGTYSLAASTFQYNGAIGEAVLFPTRLTNTQLSQLTA